MEVHLQFGWNIKIFTILFLPPANVVCEGYVFTPVCDSVNGGWHAWLLPGGVCMVAWGGMCGFFWGEACVVFSGGEHAWFFPGRGMRGFPGGCAWFFSGGGVCVGYDEIRSMSRRYASYWNAFLYEKFSF